MPRNKEQTQQIRSESREKILATARRLFAEKGYDGCNVSDIARAAGMSQGNIYWYFPSKKDIYAAVLAAGFEALGAVMTGAASGPAPAVEKFQAFLGHFFVLMKEPAGEEFFSILMALVNQGGQLHLEEFGLSTGQIGAGYHQALNAIFAQGQAEGVFPVEIEPNLLSTFLFAFINGLMLMYPGEWQNIPDEVVRQAIYRLLGMTAA